MTGHTAFVSPRRVRRRDDAPEPVRETAASAYEFHDGEQWLVRPVTGERAVKASGLYKVTKPFVANVLALRSRM